MDSHCKLKFWMMSLFFLTGLWTVNGTKAIRNGYSRIEQMKAAPLEDYTYCYGNTGYDNEPTGRTYFQMPKSQASEEFENGTEVQVQFDDVSFNGKSSIVRNTHCNIENETKVYQDDQEQAKKEFDYLMEKYRSLFHNRDGSIITCYNFNKAEEKFLKEQVAKALLPAELEFRKLFDWTKSKEKSIENGPFRLDQMKEKNGNYTECYTDGENNNRTYFQVPNSQIREEFENGSTVLVKFDKFMGKLSYVRNTYCHTNKESVFMVYKDAPKDQAEKEFDLYREKNRTQFDDEDKGKVDHTIICYNFTEDQQKFLKEQVKDKLSPVKLDFKKLFDWTKKAIEIYPSRPESTKTNYILFCGTTGLSDEKNKRTYFQVPTSRDIDDFENGSNVNVLYPKTTTFRNTQRVN